MAHHQAGRLSDAEAIYRQILQTSPDHLGALHLLGALACQVGQWTAALELINKALRINPTLAEAYNNRAAELHA
jgi:tetratricopeptide (TPR) repeat protein